MKYHLAAFHLHCILALIFATLAATYIGESMEGHH